MITKFRFTLFVVLAVAFCSTSLTGQSLYQSSVGLRLGYPVSVTYKTFLGGGNNAVEAFASYRSRNVLSNFGWTSIGVGAGYQIHSPIESVDGLQWYYGGGAALFFFSYDDGFEGFADQATLSAGILGFLGLDYAFADAPVNISLDWVPVFSFGGYGSGFGGGRGALAVRYILD